MNSKTKAAVLKYGEEICLAAYDRHENNWEGANTVGLYFGLTTNQADAAINAGRELHGIAAFDAALTKLLARYNEIDLGEFK